MSNNFERTTVELFVNGEQAEQAMKRLEKEAEDLAVAMDVAIAAGDKKLETQLAKKYNRVWNELNRTESAAKGVGIVLNDLSNTSIHGLKNALKYLQKEIQRTKPNTDQWHEYAGQIQEVQKRIAELNGEMEGGQSLWGKYKKWALGAWSGIDLIVRGYDAAVNAMSEYVDAYASMDQEMANVRKFTGLTEAQVADLNEEFKKMDTRTSREDLNKLAQEAGRLGKTSKEDIMGFVKAADVINVALDDLGDGATLTLSKLTGVFGDEARYGTEQSLLKVGSVINELSQNCAASAPYLADFASRMGGVGAQANMTIPQIMAFGAVLDSNGQAVEASATALSQVIVRMMQQPAKYAKVAGLDVKKFSDMLKTDVNGALIMFLETLQQAGGMDTLSPMFKDMGENGSRAIAALSTLATHIDEVKAQQVEANKAFREGTSAGNEFAVQNNTVQAALDKAKNAANDLRVELGEYLAPLMKHLVSSTAAVTKGLLIFIRFLMDHRLAIFSVTAAIIAYNVAVNIATIKTKAYNAAIAAGTVLHKAHRIATLASASVTALLSGNITKATKAFKLLSAAIKANPIGLAVSAITAAIAALSGWIFETYEAKKAERELAQQRAQEMSEFKKEISNIDRTAAEYAKSEQDRLKKLYDATQDQTSSLEKRTAAVKELQKTYPSAFGNLTTEAILAGKAAGAYNNLAKSIVNAARAKAAEEKIKENESKRLDLEYEIADVRKSLMEDLSAQNRDFVDPDEGTSSLNWFDKAFLSTAALFSKRAEEWENRVDIAVEREKRIKESQDKLTTLAAQTRELDKSNAFLQKIVDYPANQNPDINFDNPVVPPVSPGGGYVSQAAMKEQEKERKKREAEARRQAAKEKKEFKETLDGYKAEKMEADRMVLEEYRAGTIDYETMLARRHDNESAYYEKSLTHFETVFADQKDTYLQDDKDYQKLLLDKEKADQKYEETRISLALQRIERTKSAEEKAAQLEYDTKENPTIEDEIALQAELYAIRREALADKLALYTEGSKEYADIQYEMEKLAEDRMMEQKRLYFEAAKNLREKYDQKSAGERFKLEKATLDAMLNMHIISAEEYEKYLKKLAAEYQKDLPGDYKTEDEKENDQYKKDVQALNEALKSELVLQADFYKRMGKLDEDYYKKKIERFKSSGGEWNAMLADIGESFLGLYAKLSATGGNILEDVANCTSAVSSAVLAGMQIATQFAQAEADIQVKSIEKKYDREIELAQGNSYKVAKLEKKKEEETAKVKNKATKKQYQMQVIQAVAQSIAAGLNAYSSALAIPIIGNAIAPAAMAVALAMGATQVALLKKQQQAALANGYSKGGFTKKGAVDEPAGVVHAGEWVASQRLLASPVARPMIEALDYAQRTNTISRLRAEDVSRSITANSSLVRLAESDNGSAVLVAAAMKLSASADSMTSRLNEPFVTVATVTGDKGINRAQDEYAKMMNNITPKSKRKK